MNHIGLKIKELRKKNDMTQEKLAEYLNVSFQAVSKWETGVAAPDLSLIVPLSRLLGVSTDELFGISKEKEDPRMAQLREQWGDTWDSGDTAKRYEISKTAVKEYPGNFEFLIWLADSESSYADHNCDDSDDAKRHYENAVRYYEMIIEDCSDTKIKNDAIYGIVMNLPIIGRREEAVAYAKQHPKSNELLKWCLTGEERKINRQEMILQKLYDLVFELEYDQNDLAALQASEKIIKTVLDDGNYLWFDSALMSNLVFQAQCLVRLGQHDAAMEKLNESREHAIAFERIYQNETPLSYTCALLDKLTYAPKDASRIGMTSPTEDFFEYVSRDGFAPLRAREDFKVLIAK